MEKKYSQGLLRTMNRQMSDKFYKKHLFDGPKKSIHDPALPPPDENKSIKRPRAVYDNLNWNKRIDELLKD